MLDEMRNWPKKNDRDGIQHPGSRIQNPAVYGFSLIELMIVMALIIVMYYLMFSPASRPYQIRQMAACQKQLQQVYVSLKIYAQENGGRFPAVEGAATSEAPLSLLIPRYTTVTEIFICPGSGDRQLPAAEPFAEKRISYAYYMGRTDKDASQALVSDRQVSTLAKSAGEKVFSTDGRKPGNNHRQYGGVLLFCDGRVEGSPPLGTHDLPIPENVILLNPKP